MVPLPKIGKNHSYFAKILIVELNRMLMKKTMMFIVVFAVLIIFVSAYTNKVVDAKEGYIAPALTINYDETTVNLNELKGKYVLLSFWASIDAKSRVACNEYTTFEKNVQNKERFCLLSVNFDRNERLFREIVRRDNLNAKTQFNVQGDDAKEIKGTYHLNDGYKTFLIDPIGRIIATNPSTTKLNEILSL